VLSIGAAGATGAVDRGARLLAVAALASAAIVPAR